MHLATFNQLEPERAQQLLIQCLPSDSWCRSLVAGRPYRCVDALFQKAAEAGAPLTTDELDVAFSRRRATALSAPWSNALIHLLEARADRRRSDLHSLADPGFAERLQAYEAKFDRAFLLRLAGRSVAEIRFQLDRRLALDKPGDNAVLTAELRQIALLALARRVWT